jgi:hypothetical protein
MKKETISKTAGTKPHSRISTLIVCGIAGIALALPVNGQNPGTSSSPGAAVTFSGTVIAVREVAAGKPLEGLHADVKVDKATLDVYVAPMGFVRKYGIKVSKGEELNVTGTQTKLGGGEVVLAREITSGFTDARTGRFHKDVTVYLRNDIGPMWIDYEIVDIEKPVSAH